MFFLFVKIAIFCFSLLECKLHEGRDLVHFVHQSLDFLVYGRYGKKMYGKNNLIPEQWDSTSAIKSVLNIKPLFLSYKLASCFWMWNSASQVSLLLAKLLLGFSDRED